MGQLSKAAFTVLHLKKNAVKTMHFCHVFGALLSQRFLDSNHAPMKLEHATQKTHQKWITCAFQIVLMCFL